MVITNWKRIWTCKRDTNFVSNLTHCFGQSYDFVERICRFDKFQDNTNLCSDFPKRNINSLLKKEKQGIRPNLDFASRIGVVFERYFEHHLNNQREEDCRRTWEIWCKTCDIPRGERSKREFSPCCEIGRMRSDIESTWWLAISLQRYLRKPNFYSL